MHLIELIENNTFVAVAEQMAVNGQVEEIAAVKFHGWIKANGNIRDSVKITDILYARVLGMVSHESHVGNIIEKNQDINVNITDDLLKLKDFISDSIVILHDAKSYSDKIFFHDSICRSNRVMDTAIIAKSNYKDKINDFSLSCLARRFCPRCSQHDVVGKAKTIAYLLGQLALESDFADCGY